MKIAVLSAHRGDAALSLSLSIGCWIEAGHKVIVVNCFSRTAEAPYSDIDSVHENDRMSFATAIRGREDEAWRRQFGSALSLFDLNMKEAPLRLHCAPGEVYGLTVNPADKAIGKMQKAFANTGAQVAVGPLALDAHIDRLLIREAALVLERGGTPCAFYEDLPFAIAAADTLEPNIRELERGQRLQLAPWFACKSADPDPATARKRKAVICYDSLIDDATVEATAAACLRYQGRERLWVDTAWLATTF